LSTLLVRLSKVIVAQLGVAPEAVVPAASFTEDLHADSIELLELVMAVEEEFSSPARQIEIPDADMAKLNTVQDTANYLRGLGLEDS
jgi:acyl carrier protein